MMLTRRVLLGSSLLLPAASALAADPEAVSVISTLNQALISAMQAGPGTPFPQRVSSLQPVIDRVFDLPAILATVVGPRWGSVPADQQNRLLGVFRLFTVSSYAANFDSFSGERLEILPDNRNVGGNEVVATRVVPASGTPRRLDYVMHRTPQGWRVVDVLLDGTISQTAVQRSDFRSLLSSGGTEALVGSLQRKVFDLSGGTLRQ